MQILLFIAALINGLAYIASTRVPITYVNSCKDTVAAFDQYSRPPRLICTLAPGASCTKISKNAANQIASGKDGKTSAQLVFQIPFPPPNITAIYGLSVVKGFDVAMQVQAIDGEVTCKDATCPDAMHKPGEFDTKMHKTPIGKPFTITFCP